LWTLIQPLHTKCFLSAGKNAVFCQNEQNIIFLFKRELSLGFSVNVPVGTNIQMRKSCATTPGFFKSFSWVFGIFSASPRFSRLSERAALPGYCKTSDYFRKVLNLVICLLKIPKFQKLRNTKSDVFWHSLISSCIPETEEI
jgi:hypothetical protein